MRPTAPEKETEACSRNEGTSSAVSPSPRGLPLVLAVGHLSGRSSPGVCRWAPSGQRLPGLDATPAARRTHAVGSLGARPVASSTSPRSTPRAASRALYRGSARHSPHAAASSVSGVARQGANTVRPRAASGEAGDGRPRRGCPDMTDETGQREAGTESTATRETALCGGGATCSPHRLRQHAPRAWIRPATAFLFGPERG